MSETVTREEFDALKAKVEELEKAMGHVVGTDGPPEPSKAGTGSTNPPKPGAEVF